MPGKNDWLRDWRRDSAALAWVLYMVRMGGSDLFHGLDNDRDTILCEETEQNILAKCDKLGSEYLLVTIPSFARLVRKVRRYK